MRQQARPQAQAQAQAQAPLLLLVVPTLIPQAHFPCESS